MSEQNIIATKTAPVIVNKLPLIFDKDLNAAVFKYEFGVPSETTMHPMLKIELEYISYDISKKVIGTLSSETTITIKSKHSSQKYIQIFYEGFVREIADFKKLFLEFKLINYPDEKIIVPEFKDFVSFIELAVNRGGLMW